MARRKEVLIERMRKAGYLPAEVTDADVDVPEELDAVDPVAVSTGAAGAAGAAGVSAPSAAAAARGAMAASWGAAPGWTAPRAVPVRAAPAPADRAAIGATVRRSSRRCIGGSTSAMRLPGPCHPPIPTRIFPAMALAPLRRRFPCAIDLASSALALP